MDAVVDQALDGVCVVELAEGIAGPYAAKLMADLGADVVKVERPQVGDPARRAGPFPDHTPHHERSGLFLYVNTNKQGVTLDLNHPEAKGLFKELVDDADVLIEDCPPDWLDDRGLGYDVLRQQHPSLVMTSITRFGQEGPHAHFHASAINTFHAGGEGYTLPGRLSLDMFPDREPVQAGGCLGEYESGLCAAVATLGALLSGRGHHLDISQQEALININRPVLGHYLATGEVLSRQRGYTFGGAMPCRDGYVLLRPMEDNHWLALARAMQRDDLADDPRFITRPARIENGQLLNAIIMQWAMQQTKGEIYDLVSAAGCPVAYFATAEDVVQSPQLKARGFFVDCVHPHAGTVTMPSAGHHFSQTPWSLRRPAPMLGQHNEEIFCARLRRDKSDLTRLQSSGAI